jgi:hypothetical protein
MVKPRMPGRTGLVLAAWILCVPCAHAFDLTGLWASDSEACDKIFAKKGNKASLRKDSDMFGSGFIVDGNRIRGRTAACTIKSTKEDKGVIHLMTACATDIMLSNVQFSIKVVDDNRISRIFPGIEDITLDYVRCPARPPTR